MFFRGLVDPIHRPVDPGQPPSRNTGRAHHLHCGPPARFTSHGSSVKPSPLPHHYAHIHLLEGEKTPFVRPLPPCPPASRALCPESCQPVQQSSPTPGLICSATCRPRTGGTAELPGSCPRSRAVLPEPVTAAGARSSPLPASLSSSRPRPYSAAVPVTGTSARRGRWSSTARPSTGSSRIRSSRSGGFGLTVETTKRMRPELLRMDLPA